MTTDVRTLLHDTADAPRHGPDLDGAMRTARARRRRTRGLGALAALVVVALAGGVLAVTAGGDDGAQVAIAPRQGVDAPHGWTQVHADPGLTISIPPGWDTYGTGHTEVADGRITVGTIDPTAEIPVACPEAPGDPATGPNDTATGPNGTWVSLWEYPSDSTAVTTPLLGVRAVVERPASFSGLTTGACEDGVFTEIAFRDAGRVFLARIVVREPERSTKEELQARVDDLTAQIDALDAQLATDPPNAPALAAQVRALQNQYSLAYDELQQFQPGAPTHVQRDEAALAALVLDTLHVEPLDAVTTTTAPEAVPDVTTPRPVVPTSPTVTTGPAFVPSSGDEQAIVAAFKAWADMQTDADLDATVEDPDAVRAPSHEGWASQSPENLAAYDGRVESIHFVDSDHAQVVYTILQSGVPAYPNRMGSAVRVDGKWKVTTETVCGMLRLGGITCPV